ncbi:MAG: bifunctional nuclease family protein [Candidatus Latescibacteria bacterium]|nr:bifunctional nuclease family protein [Candidatus Latescibacterota bacterium]
MRQTFSILVICSLLACSTAEEARIPQDLVAVEILGFYPGDQGGISVVLKGREDIAVLIFIGDFEAQSLMMALGKQITPRPLTYDLVQTLVNRLGTVKRLVIHSLQDNIFHAHLVVEDARRQIHKVDCRPSDGMNIATRMDVPIFLTPQVLEEAGIKLDGNQQTLEEI